VNLSGKRALVTGAAVRVGRALALGLAHEGVHIALHYGRSEKSAEETRSEILSLGLECEIIQADLANADETSTLIKRATALLGPLDILVNSAAVYPEGGLADTDLELWDRTMAINLRAPYLLTKAFAAEPASGDRAVVNILDARSNRPAADHFAYRITKAGLEAMTKNLAADLAPGIRVNGLALGAILPPPGAPAPHLERIAAERIPLRRPGSPKAVSDSLIHLLQQDFITGAVIPLDGGEFL